MWEKVTTVVLITTYTFCVLFIVCVLLEKNTYSDKRQTLKMSSTTTFLPFQTPVIKNAKIVKLELNPFLQNIIHIIHNHFHLKMNLIQLKQSLLSENIWTHTSSILDIKF